MSLSHVGSSLQGLIRTHGGLQLLEDRNCIVRLVDGGGGGANDNTKTKVKLISGGGSGHEPAHAGYVGHGMLDGAVCGNIFSSPSVSAIVDCARTIGATGGIVFIVKNYTGDRLNFGLAVERIKMDGRGGDVRMLLVDEDCSIEEKDVRKSVGKRGLAGVVLVHKILGAMAEMGGGVDEIYRFGAGLVKSMATIGFTFERKGGALENIEIGKGIHGEPGVYTMQACKDFSEIIDFIIPKLVGKVAESSDVVLLVNNLGGTSEFLMGIFIDALLTKIQKVYAVKRTYSGTYLSSLDQAGISVTVLRCGYSPKLLEYLDFPVNVPSTLFGKSSVYNPKPSNAISVGSSEPLKALLSDANLYSVNPNLGAKLASTILTFVCEALISCKDMLNTIDSEAGDGDTGSTISKGAESIQQSLTAGKLDLNHPTRLLQQISVLLQQDMGGTSGALYSLFLQGGSSVFLNPPDGDHGGVTVDHWSEALGKGNDTIVKYALTELGDRTMLDPLREGERRLRQSVEQRLPVLECVESFTKGCEEAARATQNMIPKSGRASYAASAAASAPIAYKHPDPGAHAVSIWARALLEACKQIIVE